MALTRAYEEYEAPAELRRIYSSIRRSFDLPFVPTIFKLSAGIPSYLRTMWRDLGEVAASNEFRSATQGLRDAAHSTAVSAGWAFPDQPQSLATHGFSTADAQLIGGMVGLFTRASAQMALFARLMQRGYCGGQKGRVTASRQISALSQVIDVHVPNEREAGLRVWILYSDMKRTTGGKHVMDLYKVLSPFPGYLASAWQESKRLLSDPSLVAAREELNHRARSLLNGLPVKDHRALLPDLHPAQWREIEETVDGVARVLPQFVLLTEAWLRSFPAAARLIGAA